MNVLPKFGLLSFFVYIDRSGSCRDVARVLHVHDLGSVSRREPPPGLPKKERYRELALDPRLEWTVPSPYEIGLADDVVNEHLELWDDLRERVAEAQELPSKKTFAPVHRLLGHPDLIQTPGLSDDCKLLLQVDSDGFVPKYKHPKTGMMWGDAGRTHYLH